MKVALWSPRGSPAATWIAVLQPILLRDVHVVRVEDVAAPPPSADLHVYVIANAVDHAYVYSAALSRPGVVILHDWSIHDLLARVTLGAGDASAYVREMRRSHGETGTFVARQVARGLGGPLLPSLLAANDRLFEASLGVVAATEGLGRRTARRLPGRPVMALPLDFLRPPAAAPERGEARHALGLPESALVVAVAAADPRAARLPIVFRVLERLRRTHPGLLVLGLGGAGAFSEVSGEAPVATAGPADLVRGIAAADVVVALRFPAPGGVPEAVIRSLEVGRPVLVTAGTPPTEEVPEGVVVAVDPHVTEESELEALLGHLLAEPDLRRRIGALARAHLDAVRDPERAAARLLAFLQAVAATQEEIVRAIVADRVDERTLLGYAMEEIRSGARDLGLVGLPLGLEPLLSGLLSGSRSPAAADRP
ncbi:MAG: glycosyltransferase [Solirubrobacterales bacterium]